MYGERKIKKIFRSLDFWFLGTLNNVGQFLWIGSSKWMVQSLNLNLNRKDSAPNPSWNWIGRIQFEFEFELEFISCQLHYLLDDKIFNPWYQIKFSCANSAEHTLESKELTKIWNVCRKNSPYVFLFLIEVLRTDNVGTRICWVGL